MFSDDLLKEVVNITNNLENFLPFGVVFLTNWQGLSSKGIRSPDNECTTQALEEWSWLDFPYTEVEGMSEMVKGLVLLARRGWCRFTYKIFESVPGVAIVRIHMIPGDSPHNTVMQSYREKYFRFKRSVEWLENRCSLVMQNIVSLTDFSLEAWNIKNSIDFVRYLRRTKIPIINCINESAGIPLTLCTADASRFHMERMKEGRAWCPYEKTILLKDNNSMQNRLKRVYQNLDSPKIDRDTLHDDEDLRIFDLIQNNEICGIKSELYNFQKRSVMMMFLREINQNFKLMPNIIQLSGEGKHIGFFDIKKMIPLRKPPTYAPPRGGILAENMGLGKTLICLALICVSKFQISEIPPQYKKSEEEKGNVDSLFDICINNISQNSIPWREYYDDFPAHITKRLESVVGYFKVKEDRTVKRNTRRATSFARLEESKFRKLYLSSTTLIVIPDNLFHQWRVEIIKHIEKDYLRVLGVQTTEDMEKLNKTSIFKIVENDVLLISNSIFSKQNDVTHSILRDIYWKRLIIDEGHSMKSKISRAVLLTKKLMFERMWVISGTPTSGLTNLHVENENQEYTVQNVFDPKQDLNKLGAIVQNFFKIEPWYSNNKLWSELIVKPFQHEEFNSEFVLSQFLGQLMVRHTISDVEIDIKLPTLHHKPVFIEPSYFDKMSINLFIAVLATNAVTSERKGVDFMFDSSNKSDLRRLVTNLRKGTFYWTGFSINDVENLLNICVYSLRENSTKYSKEDQAVLNHAIFISKLALSNMRWRSVSTLHEMGYFVNGLPKSVMDAYSLDWYKGDISMYGYPHLVSIQKWFYKNRMIRSSDELNSKISNSSQDFWKGYWSNLNHGKTKGKSNKSRPSSAESRPLSNKEDYKEFELTDVKEISKLPTWVKTFLPEPEEKLVYEKYSQISDSGKGKQKIRTTTISGSNNLDGVHSLRGARILGTLSAKMNYLTMRLMENQMKGIKSIVFYEFENSAYYLTELLDLLGMNYLMYSPYIKVSERSNNLAQFERWAPMKNEGEGITLVMDLKLASHGLTIIAATHVFFMNPVWDQAVEAQAIKRSHRIGQMNEVFVETLILEGTLEEKMYNMRADMTKDNKVELIDHEGIKKYILNFPFMRMFDGGAQIEEFADFAVQSSMVEDLGDDSMASDDLLLLRKPTSHYEDKERLRKWVLPLFTQKNLDKLASQSNAAIRKRRYDNIEEIENELSNNIVDATDATSKILEKLRLKRKKMVYRKN